MGRTEFGCVSHTTARRGTTPMHTATNEKGANAPHCPRYAKSIFRQAQHKVGIDIGKANGKRLVKHLQKLLRRVQTPILASVALFRLCKPNDLNYSDIAKHFELVRWHFRGWLFAGDFAIVGKVKSTAQQIEQPHDILPSHRAVRRRGTRYRCAFQAVRKRKFLQKAWRNKPLARRGAGGKSTIGAPRPQTYGYKSSSLP